MIEWRLVRLRRLLDGPATGGTWGTDPGEDEIDVACIRGTDFDPVQLSVREERVPIRSVSSRDLKTRGLRRGDLVLEKSGGGEHQPVGRAVRFTLDQPAVPTNFACRLRPASTTSSRFLAYLLSSLYSQGVTRKSIKQTTGIQNLDVEAFLGEAVRAPDWDTQEGIADFLDAETAQIDALIEKKRRMIELLNERFFETRRSLVTGGLDPSVNLRATGVEWLSSVPRHWATTKLGYLGEIRSGSTPTTASDDYWGGDIPWVSPKDMKQPVISSTEDYVTEMAVRETGLKIIDPPAVLFVVRGMILAHTFPVAVAAVPLTINQDMKALTPATDDPRYISQLLAGLSGAILALLVEESAHGTRALRMDRWKDFPLFVPPAAEQYEIADRLADEAVQGEQTSSVIFEQVNLLMERRQALITAAVTGELDLVEAA